MSYILDALKKSDRQRQLKTTHHVQLPLETEAPQNSWPRWLLVGSLLLLTLFMLWLWKTISPDVASPSSEDAQRVVTTDSDKKPLVESPRKILEEEISTDKVSQQVEENENKKAKENKKEKARVVVSGSSRLQPVLSKEEIAEQAAREQARIEEREKDDPSRRKLTALQSGQEEEATTATGNTSKEASRQRLSDLVVRPRRAPKKKEPLSVKPNTPVSGSDEATARYTNYRSLSSSLAGMGNLHLDILAYAKEPEQRIAYINMQKYYEGAELESGARILEITQQGVVMQYRGREFILTTK